MESEIFASNLKVRHVNLVVLGLVEVLLSNYDSLLEEILIDGDSVLLRHQHDPKPIVLLLK